MQDSDLDALASRLRAQYAAEATAQQRPQIGADPARNIGGTDSPNVVEDGGVVMLDHVESAPCD